MRTLLLLLLLPSFGFAAEEARQIVYVSDYKIQPIIKDLALGFGVENADKITAEQAIRFLKRESGNLGVQRPQFWLSGREVELSNLKLWRTALQLKLRKPTDEYIQYAYDVYPRGLNVRRHTLVRNGYVQLYTHATGDLGRLDWATITITAQEVGEQTVITTVLRAHTPLDEGYRCRCVRKIANRIALRTMRPLMDEALVNGLQRGQELAAEGRQVSLLGITAYLLRRLRGGLQNKLAGAGP